MREIRFRAWDTKNKRWLELVPPEEYMLDSDDWNVPDYGDMEQGMLFYPNNPLGPTFNERIIYQQFTGLKDKNGKEVYEGDILNTPHGNVCVQWDDIWYGLFFQDGRVDGILNVPVSLQSEIKGNIFQNPELICEK